VPDSRAVACAALGVDASLRGARALRSDRPATGMCFHESTPLDLVWDERKGVGSAQRRKAERVLHHGSIKLGTTALEEGVATLRDHAPGLEAAALGERIAQSFERALDCTLERDEPTASEALAAAERAPFYSSDAFLRRR
jgi:lipoate-protein ligase A